MEPQYVDAIFMLLSFYGLVLLITMLHNYLNNENDDLL
jgi:hypothetical protein